jgi:hypothetical protein
MRINMKIYGGIDKISGLVCFLIFLLLTSVSYSYDNWSVSYPGPDFRSDYILSLAEYNGKLYAGTEGIDNGIFVYDGNNWTKSYDSNGGYINVLAAYDGKLAIANIKSPAVNCSIMLFDGTDYSTIHPGSSDLRCVYSLREYRGKLYAGGFQQTGSIRHATILVYNGTDWSVSYLGSERIWSFGAISLGIYDDRLYAGIDSYNSNESSLISFDGNTWSRLRNEEDEIQAITEYNGKLYAAGSMNRFLIFDGTNWTTESFHSAKALAVYDGRIYSAISTTIQAYNGSDWSDSYYNMTDINALAVYDGRLYAGSRLSPNKSIIFLDVEPVCEIPGNKYHCIEVTLQEALDSIKEWIAGTMSLREVLDIINSWADPVNYPPY